ncbi:hypothetical protein G7Y89_g10633 [Cudoniella acicularis]|uniref:JmjC domain-containing protein n=1 Tax=Cudoniella acicularis TaxID=354080 RepID=A0A8H4RF60_9HELO|nr:hypothetical protein G7Y89_g10633 [Cudoniella acicularis]
MMSPVSNVENPRPGSGEEELISHCLNSFCNPEQLEALQQEPEPGPNFDQSLRPCGDAILQLLLVLCKGAQDQKLPHNYIIERLDDLLEIANEKFYAFPFKEVPFCWRELFRCASFLKISVLAMESTWGKTQDLLEASQNCESPALFQILDEIVVDEVVRIIDMALIMAGPPTLHETRVSIDRVFDLLQKILKASSLNSGSSDASNNVPSPPSKRRKINVASSDDRFPMLSSFSPPILKPILKFETLSLGKFEDQILHPKDENLGSEPVIIQNCLDFWPARNERPWSSPSYLLSKTIGGRRLVPVELGRSYVDEGWGQKIISFKEFLDEYMLNDPKISDAGVGYLAQHNLFSQIPALRNDIAIPDFCYASCPPPHHSSPLAAKHSELPQLEDPLLNAWFGPAGTISPLHTDPYHNILAQVVGKKYVRLYAPRESEKLYPRDIEDGGVDMSNTSTLDIGVLAGWDGIVEEKEDAHEKFPLAFEADYVECILNEGECLYIPLGWWHYVRSLSSSFSVSFWFNGSEKVEEDL